MPTDEYQLKDNNVAVAPKPPGSAGSSKDSSKEGAAKVPQSGPGVKDGIPPPPPKNPQSKDKSADAKEASVNNDDNISPVLSSKKGSDLAGISYQKPTKDDFLNLEVVTSGGANTRLKSMKNKVLELLPSVKLPRKERYPVEKVADLPTASKTIPKIQAEKFHEESKEEKAARLNRLDKIKEVFLISWNQYKKFAWGKDEIKPVSQEGFDPFAGWSATLVDSLDTLIIMGLNDEFNEALNVVRDIDFSTTFRKDIPLFETVIRYLGGLLSAYDLADPKPPILLEKAVQLGDNLLGAFDTPNRMPKISFLWTEEAQKIKYRASSSSPFAEIGSMSVEFTRLAQLSGNSSYYDAIDRVTNAIYAMAPNNDIPYLFDQKVDASGCKLVPLPGTSKAETDPSNSNPESVSTGAKSQQPLKEDPYDVYEKAFKLDGDSEPIEEEDEEISSTDKKLASEIQSKAEELTKLSQDDDTTEAKKPSLDSIDDTPASKKKIAPGIKPPIRGSRDPLSLFSEEDIGSLGKVRKGSDVALREAAKRVNRKGWQKRAYIGDVDDEMVAEAKKIAQAAVKEAEAGLDTVSDPAKKNLKGVKSKAELAKEKVEKAASDAKSVVDDEMVREAKKIAQAAEEEVEAGLDTVSDSAKKNLEGVKSKAELAKEKVEKAASDVKSAVEDTLASTAEKAKEVIDDVPGKAAAAAERAKEILDDIPTNAASVVTSEISKESQSTASEPSSLKDAIEAEEKVNNAPSIILESSVAAVEPTSTASSKENDKIVAESKAVEKEANVGLSAGKTDIKTVIAQLGRGRNALFACEPQPALTKVNDVHSTPKYTVGGLTDSTYEYFAKEYLLLNGADDRYKELHTNTINAVNENLLFKPLVEGDPDILMVGNKIQRTPGFFQEDNEMSHLSCFIGGMYALGGKVFDRPEDVEAGAKLTDGCVWAYNVTRSGVMPENFHVRRCPEGDEKCHFDFETVDAEYKAREEVELKKLAAKGVDTKLYNPSTYSVAPNVEVVPDGRGGTRWPVNGYYDMPRSFLRMDAKYIMRPEALESVFYLYRITGEAAWQEKGWRMFESIINLTAIPDPAGGEDAPPIGYSGVQDVSDDRGTKGNFRNEAESFWMAETLKYAYLLFSDPNVIALDDWVLNTEAHPLKRTIEKQ
ncbi:hypothetical protein DV453_002393 [Geotrichum candidum]|nr:hypothetical protein DV453_002393 [Geotrichum candidum]